MPAQIDVLHMENLDGKIESPSHGAFTDSGGVTGLNMGISRTIAGTAFPPGLTYKDLEVFEMVLGPSKDTVTVLDTHRYIILWLRARGAWQLG